MPNPRSFDLPPVISRSMADALTPGVMVELTDAEAEHEGAFVESALSGEDAWASNVDIGSRRGR